MNERWSWRVPKFRGYTPFVRVSEPGKDQITEPASGVKWPLASGVIHAVLKDYGDLDDSKA